MSFTTAPDRVVPHLDVNADTGNFVYAVSQRPPGQHYMAEGVTCSWSEYMRIWGEVTGQKAVYKQVTAEEMIALTPDKDFGVEVADMFTYNNDPGYDGGMDLIRAEDLRKVRLQFVVSSYSLTNSKGRHRLSYDGPEGVHEQARLEQCSCAVKRGHRT